MPRFSSAVGLFSASNPSSIVIFIILGGKRCKQKPRKKQKFATFSPSCDPIKSLPTPSLKRKWGKEENNNNKKCAPFSILRSHAQYRRQRQCEVAAWHCSKPQKSPSPPQKLQCSIRQSCESPCSDLSSWTRPIEQTRTTFETILLQPLQNKRT